MDRGHSELAAKRQAPGGILSGAAPGSVDFHLLAQKVSEDRGCHPAFLTIGGFQLCMATADFPGTVAVFGQRRALLLRCLNI
jgi:hypothetical protein